MYGANKRFRVIRDFFINITIPQLFFCFLYVILSIPNNYWRPLISIFNKIFLSFIKSYKACRSLLVITRFWFKLIQVKLVMYYILKVPGNSYFPPICLLVTPKVEQSLKNEEEQKQERIIILQFYLYNGRFYVKPSYYHYYHYHYYIFLSKIDFTIIFYNCKEPIHVNFPIKSNTNSAKKHFGISQYF